MTEPERLDPSDALAQLVAGATLLAEIAFAAMTAEERARLKRALDSGARVAVSVLAPAAFVVRLWIAGGAWDGDRVLWELTPTSVPVPPPLARN